MNRRPPRPERGALSKLSYTPTEAPARTCAGPSALRERRHAVLASGAKSTEGIEPSPPAYQAGARPSCCADESGRRESNPLSAWPQTRWASNTPRPEMYWCAQEDSNLRCPPCRGGVFATRLCAHVGPGSRNRTGVISSARRRISTMLYPVPFQGNSATPHIHPARQPA